MKTHILRGEAQASMGTVAQLVVGAYDDSDPDRDVPLEILHRPEAVGNENVAYLVFGVPGSGSYSFMDLNHLPDDVTVKVVLHRDGSAPICSEFKGKTGNTPQAPPPPDPMG